MSQSKRFALLAKRDINQETFVEPWAEAGLSESHLHRRFKQLLGVTPKEYADGKRVARLQTELEAGRPVLEVARDFEIETSCLYAWIRKAKKQSEQFGSEGLRAAQRSRAFSRPCRPSCRDDLQPPLRRLFRR